MAPKTALVTRNVRSNQNVSPRTGSTRYYSGSRCSVIPAFTWAANTARVTTAAPAIMVAIIMVEAPASHMAVDLIRTTATTRAGRTPTGATARLGGYYPYSYGGGLSVQWLQQFYSYYPPAHGHNGSIVAAVQRRLGQLGYYHGVVDGPQTRGAIAGFESRNGLAVDGTISRPLLNTLGLA
jgi:hypothetical protein